MTDKDEMGACPFCGSDTAQTAEFRWNPVMTRWAVFCVRREPTPEMIEAGKEVPCDEVTTGSVIYSTATEAKAVWQAMIDAAAIDTGAGEG